MKYMYQLIVHVQLYAGEKNIRGFLYLLHVPREAILKYKTRRLSSFDIFIFNNKNIPKLQIPI